MEGIPEGEIRDNDVILSKSPSTQSHPGTRQYRQEGLEKLTLPRGWGWRKRAAEDVVASGRGRGARFLKEEEHRPGFYYDVGDEEAKKCADTMMRNFAYEENK